MSARHEAIEPRPAKLVRFRPMVAADIPSVGSIERAAYPFPWSEGIFRDCIRVGYLCRVAELGGKVIAYGVAALGAEEVHILNLCVRPDLRRRNVGRQMLLLLLQRAREAGMKEAFLEVRPSNGPAIALYESLGFGRVGLRRGYYQAEDGREDAIVLKLDLGADEQVRRPC